MGDGKSVWRGARLGSSQEIELDGSGQTLCTAARPGRVAVCMSRDQKRCVIPTTTRVCDASGSVTATPGQLMVALPLFFMYPARA